jgi:hypothetical protein
VTKNITLSVQQSVLKSVRRIAAERDTTVNGLVRKYLEELAGQAKQRASARRELVKFIPTIRTKIGSIRWSREELHAR